MAVEYIQTKGFKELGERLKALALDFKQGAAIARATTNAGAQVIKKLAIQKAPVGPPAQTPAVPFGYLKKNIIVRYNRRQKTYTSEHAVTVRSKGKGIISEDVSANPYAIGIYQEFGTVHHGPHAFMRPALDGGKIQAINAMYKRMLIRIEKAEKK